MKLRAPFPWFGGKSRVADIVWRHLGDVPNYVEPFFGSGAVLLGRPSAPRIETVNDRDCYLSNFWRAVTADPEKVARFADWPVNEADLHARHRWLVKQKRFRERMKHEPDFYDAKIAGWWVWGICQWIGSGWCSAPEWTGRVAFGWPRGISTVDSRRPAMTANGVHAGRVRDLQRSDTWGKRPALERGGKGVHRTTPEQLPDISGDGGAAGRGIHASARARRSGVDGVSDWFEALAARLRRVRVCCGDWSRILGPSPTVHIGVTGVFLDPPYGHEAERDGALYTHDGPGIAAEVRQWALEHGADPRLRIALCGYEGEHDQLELAGWSVEAWKAPGGYAVRANSRGRKNATRERIWFSPHCIRPVDSAPLFAGLER